ncbi:hypothetical protein CWM58_27175 [Klebsiella sp. H-Nf2]|nr:hypothetical protein CWM58_27175 [Klebsiella sp. H-Nf2]
MRGIVTKTFAQRSRIFIFLFQPLFLPYIEADPPGFCRRFVAILWIILCVKGYKAGFCWGMQQSVIFLPFFYCRRSRTPYNAPPSTRRM